MKYLHLYVIFNVDKVLNEVKQLSATIIGQWGRALRDLCCLSSDDECEACEVSNCSYALFFQNQIGGSKKYRPYMMQTNFVAPAQIYVGFKIFGCYSDLHQVLFQSTISLDGKKIYIEYRDYSLSLKQIMDTQRCTVYKRGSPKMLVPQKNLLEFEPEEAFEVSLDFTSVLRQKYQGNFNGDFQWAAFAKSLIRRLRYINLHFNQSAINIPKLIDIDHVRVIQNHTYWRETNRVSDSQNRKNGIGGLLGKITLQGLCPDMVAILKLGQYLHAGGQCTFGNEGYRIIKMSDALVSNTY